MSANGLMHPESCISQAVSRKPRLLLADDNTAVLKHVSGFLANDFDVAAVFTDGQAVLDSYREQRPDLFVLDISMGRMSGLDVARRLRKSGSESPIVFLSVHREADFVNAALGAGGSAYVVKSHMTKDLIPAIRAALAGEMFVSPSLVELP